MISLTLKLISKIHSTATYPLDLTKTRLQIQGEAKANGIAENALKPKVPYRGMMATGVGICREEGALKLWQGVTPALYRHVVYSGVRIVVYDKLRKKIVSNGSGTALWQSAVCGVSAGGLAQWFDQFDFN